MSEAATPIPLVSERLGEIQLVLREKKIEGWLFSDHRGQNPLALRALGIKGEPLRRVLYWLPADGMPVLIAHAMELETMPELPGETLSYTGWAELRRALDRTLPTRGAIAMEHASIAASPDVSRVEAGTVGLVTSYGATVVPSIDLVNAFIGTLAEHEVVSLRKSVAALAKIRDEGAKKLAAGDERELRSALVNAVEGAGLTLVRAMVTSGEGTRGWPREAGHRAIGKGEHALVDLFAKEGDGPCAHLSFVLSRGESPRTKKALAAACDARDAAIELVGTRLRRSEKLLGFEVDDAARAALAKAGQKAAIRHRTGSHVGRIPFSAEACTFDSLELEDTRAALAGHAWSVHPGVYDEQGGVRAHAVILATASGVEVLDRGPREPLALAD
jgi:Xaa-Pro dipeptidase